MQLMNLQKEKQKEKSKMERSVWLSLTKTERKLYSENRTDYAERLHRDN